VPREALAFLNSTPFLQGLQQGQVNFEGTAVTRQLRPLADANVHYLVLHKDLLSPETVAAWQQWLPFPPVHDNDALLVYQTRPKVGQDLELAYPLTAELGLIQAQVLTTQTAPRGLVQVRALWGSTAVPTTDYDLCWQLRRSAQEVAQSDCVPLADRPTSQWLADDMVRGEYAFTVAPSLAPGTYEVALTLGQSGEIVTPPAAVGTVDVHAVAWPVTWDDLILLTDYTVQPTRDTVELTFYWQALQPIDTSYKIFLHLRDVVTGEVVAQTDTFPVGWTYLTDQWAVGEVVEDHISLPVADVPPGSYQLFVGFYEEDSGERLPTTFADNSVPLSGYGR
jgi:hypothetical protein